MGAFKPSARSCAAVVVSVFVICACGISGEHSDGWNTGEENVELTPIVQGIYEVEFEVVDDGCEPSLEEIFGRIDNWPPPQVLVFNTEQQRSFNLARIPVFKWREARYMLPAARTDDEFTPYSTVLARDEWASLWGFNRNNCPYRYSESPFWSEVEITSVGPDTLEVRITSEWGDLDVCVDERTWERYATIPTSDCEETYKVMYTLKEECPLPCEPDGGNLHGSLEDGYPSLTYRGPMECKCD